MEADLVSVEEDSVTFSRAGRTYNYPIGNLSDEDQQFVRDWAVQNTPSVLGEELKNQIVRLEGRSFRNVSDDALKNKRLFAFYYSAGWCGPCRRFTPELVKFYEEAKTRYPEFEVIFISSDQDQKAMTEYMQSSGMPFLAMKFDRKEKSSWAKKYAERGIPNLVFLDGSGEVLSASYVDGQYVGPRKVLADIEKHLAGK